MMVLFAALLLAQAEPINPGPGPEQAEAAAGHEASHETEREAREEKEEEGIAAHIFHHVQDETVVPLGFWAGNRYIRLDITKHLINMWISAGILLIVVGLGGRKRALIPKGSYNLLESLVMFIRDEISVK